MRAALSHPGPVKKSITATGQVGSTFETGATYQLSDDHLSREATGFTYGTENAFYNADGTPKSVTKDTFEVHATGLRLYFGSKGITGYSVDQTDKDAKILKFIRSSGTILDPDTILDPETYLV